MRLLTDAPPTSRVGRYPKHTFNTKELAFTAVPFMIAPVLPGETLSSIWLESRVVGDPIKNSIIGWKKEYHFFYVKVTDLLNDTIRDMFVDPTNTDLGATLGIAANSTPYYTAKGGIDYLLRGMKRIVDTWFRDDGEVFDDFKTADGVAIVQIKEKSWMDSLTDKDAMPEGAAIASATDAGDLDRLMDAFNHLRSLGLANMTYEDFLRSYGLAIPAKDENKPEKLASFTDWSYPVNTIDPTTGAAASALSWVFRTGDRDPKLFKEPGFIIGVSITRPKVYFSGLAGNLAAHMTRAWDWVPNYMEGAPETSLKNFAGDTGPLGDRTTAPDGYWVDMRDLLLHGDQFQNHTAFALIPAVDGSTHMMPLPDGATFKWKYPTEAQAKSFFKTAGSEFIRQDGMVSLGIKGRQVDYTQNRIAKA